MHKGNKKRVIMIVTMSLILTTILCSCGGPTAVSSVIDEKVAEEKEAVITDGAEKSENMTVTEDAIVIPDETTASTDIPISEESTSFQDDEGYVDLTVLSATAVYAEVYDMMFYPEKYIGKTVKMKGLYDEFYDETTKKRYHACIIMDATACCAQGIEFILTDDYSYPDDYPHQADDIVVEGIFDVYTEESGSYCTLRNSRLF